MPEETPTCRAPIDARLAGIIDLLLAPVTIVAADGRILHVNPAGADTMLMPASWLVGRNLLDFVHPSDRPKARRRFAAVAAGRPQGRTTVYRLRAGSSTRWTEVESFAVNLLEDTGVRGILIAGRDVTDARSYQRQLRKLAYHDPLTGLPNGRELHEVLDGLLGGEKQLAAGFVGLDRFKLINDSLGHVNGDAVLLAAAQRIAQSIPRTCRLFRFNGDVFVVLAPGDTATGARPLFWRIVQRLAEPLFIAGYELQLSASVGIVGRETSSTAESLLRDAELALHSAKTRGGGRVEQYEPTLGEAALTRLELEANIRLALAKSRFSLAMQPIVQLPSREPVCSEALLRWHDDDRTIPPGQFIGVAEETGIIVPLGEWIIDEAARLARRVPGGRVQVNLSGRQLASPGLPGRIVRAVSVHGLPEEAIAFEVTETVLIEHFDHASGVLQALRELGFRVGLDDFGTGYSSLSYLRRLPIDFLKVDRSLVADVATDAQARTIVGAIITMAHALGLDVVAEGVETEGQAAQLEELGCQYAQGYLFGRPSEDIEPTGSGGNDPSTGAKPVEPGFGRRRPLLAQPPPEQGRE